MILFSYQRSREEIVTNLRSGLSAWGGHLVGDINSGGFSVLEDANRICAAYRFTYEHVYMDIVDKPDYVTDDIIEEALRPLFDQGSFALFESLLEEVANPEDELETA